MSYQTIIVERRGPVALFTLNRPDKLNAWTPKMSEELADAVDTSNEDSSVGAIIVTGAGRGFCAGADMEATFKTRIDGGDPGANTAEGQGGMPAGLDWVELCRRSKPMVAAVNGAAVGIGLTQILPFDVIVASEKAKFGMGFIKMGLVPELASTHLLVARMGFGRASEMTLSGRLYSGREAGEMGLAEHVTAPEALIDKAVEIAESFAANPDWQLRMTKALLTRNGAPVDLGDVQRSETEFLRECWKSSEHAEAVNAFIEKRPAKLR